VPEEPNARLEFIYAAATEQPRGGPFVVIVRTREEFARALRGSSPSAEWLQVEDLLDDPEVWALAAQGSSHLPLDVVLADPEKDFSSLYRLADVRITREVRVTLPATPGMLKALRLAASLQLRVRLLPGQPTSEALPALREALDFYLHDPAVEAPIEFFHSLLAALREGTATSLWDILEQDPAVYVQPATAEKASWPADFVATHLAGLVERGTECATCSWQNLCAGYFKWPDPNYSCTGIRELLDRLREAAEEIGRDLAACTEADPAASPAP
jgi:hypothetical protein